MKAVNCVVLALACTLAGCSDRGADSGKAGPSPIVTVPGAAEAPVTIATGVASTIAENHLEMLVDDPRVQNWEGIGARQPGLLASNATNGYLMYGPKVPFRAGKYRVDLYGDQLLVAKGNSITLDATSDAGRLVHGKLELGESSATGNAGKPLASFEFALPADVQDLEIRAFVTSGSSLSIRRYQVVPVSAP